jgi:hypothetical protein
MWTKHRRGIIEVMLHRKATRIPRVGGRKNHGEDEKAREKESTTCKLGRPICVYEV